MLSDEQILEARQLIYKVSAGCKVHIDVLHKLAAILAPPPAKQVADGELVERIAIPEGMLKAVAERWPIRCMEDKAHVLDTLESALRWQDAEIEKLIQSDPYANDPYYRSESMSENYVRTGYNKAIRNVRRMFLAPTPEPFTPYLFSSRPGGTRKGDAVSCEEADEHIRQAFEAGKASR